VTFIHAPAGHIRGVVCGTQHAALRAVTVAFDHLKVIENFALIPDMVAGGDDIDIQLEQFLGQRWSNSETGGRVLSVGDDEIDGVVANDAGKPIVDDGSSRPSENVADEENAHRC